MNKKGDAFQILFLLILTLCVAITGLIFLKLSHEVNNAYANLPMMNQSINSVAKSTNQIIQNVSIPTVDYAIFFLFLIGTLGITIASIKTNFSPSLVFIFICLLIYDIFVAMGTVNIYQGLASDPSIIDVSSQLTLTNIVFSRYTPLIIGVIGAAIMLLMWGKSGGEIVT